MEGVCFIDSNEESMSFVVVSLKGNICVYKVKCLDAMAVDSCYLDWQVSISDILKTRTQNA
jgi:hypothetical protein